MPEQVSTVMPICDVQDDIMTCLGDEMLSELFWYSSPEYRIAFYFYSGQLAQAVNASLRVLSVERADGTYPFSMSSTSEKRDDFTSLNLF